MARVGRTSHSEDVVCDRHMRRGVGLVSFAFVARSRKQLAVYGVFTASISADDEVVMYSRYPRCCRCEKIRTHTTTRVAQTRARFISEVPSPHTRTCILPDTNKKIRWLPLDDKAIADAGMVVSLKQFEFGLAYARPKDIHSTNYESQAHV